MECCQVSFSFKRILPSKSGKVTVDTFIDFPRELDTACHNIAQTYTSHMFKKSQLFRSNFKDRRHWKQFISPKISF